MTEGDRENDDDKRAQFRPNITATATCNPLRSWRVVKINIFFSTSNKEMTLPPLCSLHLPLYVGQKNKMRLKRLFSIGHEP